VTVAGLEALAVTFADASASGGSRATTTLIVDLGNGCAQVFVLQAPGNTTADVEPALLGSIQPAG